MPGKKKEGTAGGVSGNGSFLWTRRGAWCLVFGKEDRRSGVDLCCMCLAGALIKNLWCSKKDWKRYLLKEDGGSSLRT